MAVNENVLNLTQQTGTADPTSIIYAAGNTNTSSPTDTGLPVSVLFNNSILTGTPTVAGYLTSALAASTYLTQANASSTYLTQTNAASTYLTITTAASTYATITNLNLKAPLASPTFTGTVVIPTVTLSGGTINSTSVGATTASTGKFTTLQATSTITPSTTAGIVGTTLADNAQAGSVGELITNTTSGTSVTTVTALNLTSISLTPGDWEVSGMVSWLPASTTTVSQLGQGISIVSATLGTFDTWTRYQLTFTPGPSGQQLGTPTVRINVSATTTVFLVGIAGFAVSTMTANGFIRARRVR